MLVIFLIFGVLASLAFRIIFTINKYEIDKEKLMIKSLLNYDKSVIYLNDVISCTEMQGKYNTELVIATIDGKDIKLPHTMRNYVKFKDILIKDKPFTTQAAADKQKNDPSTFLFIALGIAPILLGLFLIKVNVNEFSNRHHEISYQELKTLSITITDISIDKEDKEEIWIKAKEFPNYKFYILNDRFRAINLSGFEKYVRVGDKIEVNVMQKEYEQKSVQEEGFSLFGKKKHQINIGIYGLQKDNTKFLQLDDINMQHKNSYSYFGTFIFILASLLMIVFGSFMAYTWFVLD